MKSLVSLLLIVSLLAGCLLVQAIVPTPPPDSADYNKCDVVRCGWGARCDPSTGRCQCNQACPRIYKPICGTDGKTYANDCLLLYETCVTKGAVSKSYDGKCKCKNTKY